MIWLLRHGEAAEGSPDEARPLTERGEEQARTAGLALAKLGVQVGALPVEPQGARRWRRPGWPARRSGSR